MVIGNTARAISINCLLALSAGVLWAGSSSMPVRAQTVTIDSEEADELTEEFNELDELTELDNGESTTESTDGRPLSQDGSVLSLMGAQRLMEEAATAVSNENYSLAVEKYQSARQVYNQLSNFYQDLASSFSGIDILISSSHRDRALETAQKRDEATYRLALVHRAQDTPDLAVPLLIQIIRSQQPTRELGENAYRQLYELGFVDSPFPDSQDVGSTTPVQPASTLNN